MKLFFFGSEVVSRTEYDLIVIKNPEEMDYLREVEARMLAVMNHFGIPGFSAPQLGIPIQMAIVKLGHGKKLTLLNPRITRMYGSETEYSEGCISFPPAGNICPTPRMQFIEVVGASIENPAIEKCWNFTSSDGRIVQHEIDHLRGTFFFERAKLVEQRKALDQFHRWKQTMKQTPNFGVRRIQ